MADLKSKYKSTEIGAIPIDWELKTIGELGDLFKGKGISKSEILETGLPCIRYGELYTKYNTKFANTFSFCSDESASLSQAINKGDIVFAGSGETVEDIGKCAVYLGDEIAYAGGDTIILRPQNVDSIYLSYLLNYDSVAKQRSVLGQGNSVVHIYPKSIATILVQIPSLKEQTKIAKILSTWDNTIESLEQLIVKKERSKRALMQQLLTGNKRFKEFKGENWKSDQLGNVCKLINGMAFKPSDWVNEGLPIIRIQNLNGSNEFNFYNGNYDERYVVEAGSLLFSWSGSRGTSFGPNIWKGKKGILNQHIFIVKPDNFMNLSFLFYELKYITQIIENKAHGSAGLVHVTKGELEKQKINIPPIKEQIKIASILSASDMEIQTLSTQLLHYSQQKKGLQQQLLTGKIRVKI